MTELETFRSETREWLAANCPASLIGNEATAFDGCWGGQKATWDNPDEKRWLDVMVEKRWTAPTWPTQYGGGGLSEAHARIIRDEMAALSIPPPLVGFGLTMIGPALLAFANDELKQEHLPPIVRGEIRWAQGYSEPGSGSDLASLRTSCVRDGDEWVVNGQKCWTSYADLSDWMFMLVRTDPDAKKQAGITFLLVDMATAGVSVQPTLLISGKSPFCETFFEDVRVPLGSVVGEINDGWTVGKAVLEFERSTHGDVFSTPGASEENPILAAARKYAAGEPLDPTLRHQVAQIEMDRLCFEATIERIRLGVRPGEKPGPASSMFKLYASEFNLRRQHLLTGILGPQSLGWEGEGFEEEELEATRDWLRSRGNTIEGGTSEIQLGIIAKRVLGLPD